MSNRGYFIALEGGEGSGKSTVAAALQERLSAGGHDVVLTREPGGTDVAEAIRDLLLSDRCADADPWCEALLFAAARADHVGGLIRPALARGAVVVCDRFVDSSVAYQGIARGLGESGIRLINDMPTREAVPDLTVVLDIDPEIGLDRVVGANHMDELGVEFHRTVRTAFLDFAARDPQRYVVVDAAAEVWQVVDAIAVQLQHRGLRVGS